LRREISNAGAKARLEQIPVAKKEGNQQLDECQSESEGPPATAKTGRIP
jgi:hypothetical protein